MAEEIEIDPTGFGLRKAKGSAIFESSQAFARCKRSSAKNEIEIRPMPQANVHLKEWKFAAAVSELSIWLDRNHCIPESFAISKLANGDLLVRVEFSDDAMAEVFEREFAR